MSVSLVLMPVALALRVVMGKERFESWVDSLQIKIPTSFRDEKDLLLTVRKAGYDAEKWGGSYKTHIRKEELWFFWERINGTWTAIFGKSDPRDDIKAFISDLESKAGRRVFRWDEEAQKPVVIQTYTYPTNFRDPALLRKALVEYGLILNYDNSSRMECNINGMSLTFSQEGEQPFLLEIKNSTDMRHVHSILDDLNDSYSHNVQALTYERLKSRVAHYGLLIENEEVADDNSLIITLSMQS